MKDNLLVEFHAEKNRHLLFSVILDILGMISYVIPFLGESVDLIFAPFYGLAIFIMYKKRIASAMIGGISGAVEELLPGADVVPTATIMWIYTYVIRKDNTLKNFVKGKNKEMAALNDLNR